MDRTYVFSPDKGSESNIVSMLAPLLSQRGIDPNILLAMNNNGFGNGNSFIWVLFLLLLGGNWGGFGGFGYGNGRGTGFLANEISNDYGRDLLLQAINGNRSAIDSLASTLHCSVGDIQNAICALSSQVQGVGNQVGMSSQQIINAIQSGNCSIAGQLAQCCCDLKGAIKDVAIGQERGFASVAYETQRQTCDIEKSISASTQAITSRLDAIEKNALMDKIDALREKNGTLTTQLNLEHQNAYVAGVVAQGNAPVNAALADLSARLGKIECKQPETVTLPYSPVVGVPNCVAAGLGLGWGYGWNGNGSLWG